MATFYIKQNDTRPSLYAQLLQDGSVVDLTGCTVLFGLRGMDAKEAVITDAATGNVRYDWEAEDTATTGNYQAEFEVTFADATVETFPNNDYLTIVIMEEVVETGA
jgi:hypothetical protein